MKHRLPLSLLFCVLVRFGLALGCEWYTYWNYKLVSDSAGRLGDIMEVSTPEKCQEKCCEDDRCDAVQVGFPMDGLPQCWLLSCGNQTQDLCGLTESSSSQFRFYSKNRDIDDPLRIRAKPQTNETIINCRQPKKVGYCRAALPRYYYDVTNRTCSKFLYGGCGANANNFNTQEECEAMCSGVTGTVLLQDSSDPAPPENLNEGPLRPMPYKSVPAETKAPAHPEETAMSAEEYAEKCEVEPEVGLCRAAFQRWYYNPKSGECKTFIYGGCKGNKNNYVTEKSCKDTCAVSEPPPPKKSTSDDVSREYRDQCMASADTGPCRAAFIHFYFDYQTGTCESFLYGGCLGNANRYASMEDCMSTCGNEGSFRGHGHSRNRWTAGIFLFITLAVISALLLVTLVLISLRRHRLSRRSSVSDKEELLPDEQSSVDSITLPPSPKPEIA